MCVEFGIEHVAIIAYADLLSIQAEDGILVAMMILPRSHALTRWWLLILLLASVLLYLAFRSVSLDDFDSYSFALALEQFDLALQQPQPPGFPVYVGLASLLQRLLHSPTLTLTTLSALCGGLSVAMVGLLGHEVEGRPSGRRPSFTGALAALLFGLAPVTWLTSEKALSDMPGLLWTLLPLWLWHSWRARQEQEPGQHPPILAAAATGIALGVRPQNALPIALWLFGTMLADLLQRRSMHPWLIGAGFGFLGVLIWLVPVARVTGGLPQYLGKISEHAAHVGRSDSLGGMVAASGSLVTALRARGLALTDTLLLALIGEGIHPPSGPLTAWHALALAGIIVPGFLAANWRARATHHLLIWLAAVTVQSFLFETLDRPRLLLPLVPPLALLVASGWARLRAPRLLRAAVLSCIPLALLLQTLPYAASLSRIPAPPSQATAHIRAHYPPEETLVAAAGAFRAAQVELTAYPLAYLYRFDPAQVSDRLHEGLRYVAILDRDQFTTEALGVLTFQGSWVTLEDLTFARDRRIHTQHDQVRLHVLVSPEHIPASALRLPEGGCIDIGGDSDGRYLGQGWFRPEEVSGVSGRWSGQTTIATLRFSPNGSQDLVLSMRALAFPANQSVTIRVNGTLIGTLSQPQAWTEMSLVIPQTAWAAVQPAVLELVHESLASPAATTEGGSSDNRDLTTAYDWVCLVPGPAATP
jgi:hypothetical protein